MQKVCFFFIKSPIKLWMLFGTEKQWPYNCALDSSQVSILSSLDDKCHTCIGRVIISLRKYMCWLVWLNLSNDCVIGPGVSLSDTAINYFCPENVVCLLHLLHIIKHTQDWFYHGIKNNESWSDCSWKSSLIWSILFAKYISKRRVDNNCHEYLEKS